MGLSLHGLFYADEVRSIDDVDIDLSVDITDGEMMLAQQLIDQLTDKKFDASLYEDEYRKSVLSAIDRKVAGEEIVVAEQETSHEQIIDLVAALKQSIVDREGGDGGRKKPARKTTKAKPRKKAARSK